VIVRWGLDALPELLGTLGIERPLLVMSRRWAHVSLPVERRFAGVRPHAEMAGVRALLEAAGDADGLVALGGGSAIDSAKAVSAELGLPVVSIPTTYSGAEWTPSFAVRAPELGVKRGGAGARVEGIVYDPSLTLHLPRDETCGTALNALAHCAEALYTRGRTEETDEHALAGARLISGWLPPVVLDGLDYQARTHLLEGAMHAGAALTAGMGVGHAMAQALGGRYGLSHGAMNAVCLPAALRFNSEAAEAEIRRFGEAMGRGEPVARVEELARLGGFGALRDFGVPRDELAIVAEAAAARAGAGANPQPASPEDILRLLESVW
jgi:maleylacetate reductase